MIKEVVSCITFDDVLLVPGYSDVLPSDVSIVSKLGGIDLPLPFLSSAMDTVTDSNLAKAMAHEGGIGVIHKNMSISQQVAEVIRVKNHEHGVVKKPLTISSNEAICKVSQVAKERGFSGMPVVDDDKLVGIITNRDMRFEQNKGALVKDCMTPRSQLIVVREGESISEVLSLMHKHRVEKIPMLNAQDKLVGMYTLKDILQSQRKPVANKDLNGQLRVAAAVGVGGDSRERSLSLIEAGADMIVIDTAHGHSKSVIEHVEWLRSMSPSMNIVAGNIATAEAALALAKAGADIVKVGIGPGSICTTRVIAGVGVPQISAIDNVARALKDSNVKIIADGGIRYSGDIVKAMAAGADAVMLGGLLAGTKESPGSVELYHGRMYKSYRGMGSVSAMSEKYGSKDRYFQADKTKDKLVPEGVEGRVQYKGELSEVLRLLVGGLKSGMGYVGAKNINDLHEKASFCQVSSAGVREGHVHDVYVTKESPNYSAEE